MNNWSEAELMFRCERLSVRLERLAASFLQLSALSQNSDQEDAVLAAIRDCKMFLELTAIDLDVDTAFELAQMQRQLSRWHIHWIDVWADVSVKQTISTSAQAWAERLQVIAGVLV
jgi:hypothetical protein